jgi:predicted nucleic acid-binding protein
MRLLIDTNVVLDALMNRNPWAEPAQKLLVAVAEEKAEGCITASMFTDIHYILKKHLKDEEKTRQALIGLLSVVTVLDVTESDCERAFELPMKDYEDALLVYCGKRHKVDLIVTRNMDDFKGSPVKTLEPVNMKL